MGKKLKFGFSLKKKKKSKAELWQEGAPPPPEPYNPASYDREGPPYDEPYYEYDPEQPSAPYDDDDSPDRSYNRATMVSQRSHPDYDPYNADYYIPSSNRRSQFDNSVLMQREQDTKQYNDEESEPTATYPDERYQSPQYNYQQSYQHPPWKKDEGRYTEQPQPYDESEYSAESYPVRHDYQDQSEVGEPRRERTAQDPQLSDINEDQERYFQQQEWNDTGSDDGRGSRSYGAKMVEMCDNMAEGISEALSRFFQSASLFCKTCFWSRNSNWIFVNSPEVRNWNGFFTQYSISSWQFKHTIVLLVGKETNKDNIVVKKQYFSIMTYLTFLLKIYNYIAVSKTNHGVES